jgi:hypothetical protein
MLKLMTIVYHLKQSFQLDEQIRRTTMQGDKQPTYTKKRGFR